MKRRIRLGIRFGWPFPNACIFVVYVNDSQLEKLSGAFATIGLILNEAGRKDIADKLVFEQA